jgi:hypothetical protein
VLAGTAPLVLINYELDPGILKPSSRSYTGVEAMEERRVNKPESLC